MSVVNAAEVYLVAKQDAPAGTLVTDRNFWAQLTTDSTFRGAHHENNVYQLGEIVVQNKRFYTPNNVIDEAVPVTQEKILSVTAVTTLDQSNVGNYITTNANISLPAAGVPGSKWTVANTSASKVIINTAGGVSVEIGPLSIDSKQVVTVRCITASMCHVTTN